MSNPADCPGELDHHIINATDKRGQTERCAARWVVRNRPGGVWDGPAGFREAPAGSSVVAGFDLLEERTRQLAEMCSSRSLRQLRQMLKDDELDLVIVATRSHEHVAMAIQAMKAGQGCAC